MVEFIATGRVENTAVTLHEISRFQKEDDQWLYVDGDIHPSKKAANGVGRNSPCPCGSGKKFKKCCNR